MGLIFIFFFELNFKYFLSRKRVYSGVSAILDFKIVNFRKYDCTKESRNNNCRIVELFLTVDTSRKMQNGVNIDVSIDRYAEFHQFLTGKNSF